MVQVGLVEGSAEKVGDVDGCRDGAEEMEGFSDGMLLGCELVVGSLLASFVGLAERQVGDSEWYGVGGADSIVGDSEK